MIQFNFAPDANLIVFPCVVKHSKEIITLLALDTGASSVILSEEVLDLTGYDVKSVIDRADFSNASQSHRVPVVLLDSFGLPGAEESNIEALCYTVPEEHGIEGVIGLNYLRRFRKVILDFENGMLTLERREKN